MPLERLVYDVHLNPDDYDPKADPFNTDGVVVHRVVVTHADQLRGEMESARRGITDARLGQAMTSIILWVALVRLGLYERTYESFRDADCALMESVRAPQEDVVVPPTVEPQGSESASPIPSPDSSPIGSTPTSTNA